MYGDQDQVEVAALKVVRY